MNNDLTQYASLLSEIKTRIGQAQARAAFSANREMLALYWDIGQLITERQRKEGCPPSRKSSNRWGRLAGSSSEARAIGIYVTNRR